MEMNTSNIVPVALFVIGIGVMFGSGGSTIFMLGGDILIAAAGIAFIKFGK